MSKHKWKESQVHLSQSKEEVHTGVYYSILLNEGLSYEQ